MARKGGRVRLVVKRASWMVVEHSSPLRLHSLLLPCVHGVG